MRTVMFSKLSLIKLALWSLILFSATALVYHTRWFIPFLNDRPTPVLFGDQLPALWFIVQICSNVIFLIVGILLLRLFRHYGQTGFFDRHALRAFDITIYCCFGLALLRVVQTVSNNFYEVQLEQWTSFAAIANLTFRSFTRLLVFKEPETLYFLLAIVLWVVKQFVSRALVIKRENESFV